MPVRRKVSGGLLEFTSLICRVYSVLGPDGRFKPKGDLQIPDLGTKIRAKNTTRIQCGFYLWILHTYGTSLESICRKIDTVATTCALFVTSMLPLASH